MSSGWAIHQNYPSVNVKFFTVWGHNLVFFTVILKQESTNSECSLITALVLESLYSQWPYFLGIENQLTANMLALFLLRRSGWFETDVVVSGENSFWSRLFYTRSRQRERKEAEAEEGPFSKGGFWASCDMARRDLRSIDDYATCTVVSGSCMELLSRRRWTTGLAQHYAMYLLHKCLG